MNVERYVRLIAGIVVLVSVAAGTWVSPWFFAVAAAMGANLIQSAFTNWCPAMPVLRRLGVSDGPGTGLPVRAGHAGLPERGSAP